MGTVEWIRFFHLIESTLLFGVGVTAALNLILTYRQGNAVSLAQVLGNVIKADYYLTTPAVLLVPLTGFYLVDMTPHNYDDFWVVASVMLYVLTSFCWIPAVRIQGKMHLLALEAAAGDGKITSLFSPLMRQWVGLWVITFLSLLAIYGLMVFKPKGF